MRKPVQRKDSIHPGGGTPLQVKEIRGKEIAAPLQRKTRRSKRALHQARHLQRRSRDRASILRRIRRLFSARSSGFFMGLRPLRGAIGMRMTIPQQEAQRADPLNQVIAAQVSYFREPYPRGNLRNSCKPFPCRIKFLHNI